MSVLHSTATLFQEHKLEYYMPFKFAEVVVRHISFSIDHHCFPYPWLQSGTNEEGRGLAEPCAEKVIKFKV